MKRCIAVFSGTRAEYGLLRPLLLKLKKKDCTLKIIASGTHLSEAHGHTLEEIRNDGFSPICVDMQLGGDTSLCRSMGLVLEGAGKVFEACPPDLLVVLGDRYETFCAVAAATIKGIPIAHIHGGETTIGAIDEAFRHSITKMSHLHFTSCEPYRQRVMQLGENPERVWNVGALGVENALTLHLPDEEALRRSVGLSPGPYILCTFHPVTLEPGQETAQLQSLLNALDALPSYSIIFTGANADVGGNAINALLRAWASAQEGRVKLVSSLGVVRYLAAAKYAACVVGNSSSGILEVPSLGTPVLDIGNRQLGRIRSQAALSCEASEEAISAGLRMALSQEYRKKAQTALNPYQGENTSSRIVDILLHYPLQGILKKIFYDYAGPVK